MGRRSIGPQFTRREAAGNILIDGETDLTLMRETEPREAHRGKGLYMALSRSTPRNKSTRALGTAITLAIVA
ncbi:MAG: hypothetical protein ACC652_06900, partial [Acidimicrobiales bacterium]